MQSTYATDGVLNHEDYPSHRVYIGQLDSQGLRIGESDDADLSLEELSNWLTSNKGQVVLGFGCGSVSDSLGFAIVRIAAVTSVIESRTFDAA